jgi:hypothetical protein
MPRNPGYSVEADGIAPRSKAHQISVPAVQFFIRTPSSLADAAANGRCRSGGMNLLGTRNRQEFFPTLDPITTIMG